MQRQKAHSSAEVSSSRGVIYRSEGGALFQCSFSWCEYANSAVFG